MRTQDKSDSLEVDELKVALKRFHGDAQRDAADTKRLLNDATAFREKAAKAVEVAQATRLAETAALAVEAGIDNSVGSKLGVIMNKKGMKSTDLAIKWDKSGKGEVEKKEFRHGVLKLTGMETDEKEIDALFDSLDVDGGGTLDLRELSLAFKAFQDKAEEARQSSRKLILEMVEQSRKMKSAQATWKRMRQAEEEEEALRRQEVEKRAEAEAAAAEEAKRAKAAAAAAKKAKEEAEKAAFQAKIDAKRKKELIK